MKSYFGISHLFFALVVVLLVACQSPHPIATPAPAKTEAATAPTSTSLSAAPTITLAPPAATSVTPTATRQPTATPMPPLDGRGGGVVAFYSERDGNSEIYAMNADGAGLRRLTHDPAEDDSPAISPDGSRIVFLTSRHDPDPQFPFFKYEIYAMDTDGTNLRRLTTTEAVENHPAWSPDGKKILFDADYDGDGKYEIYTMNADGTGVTRLTTTHADDRFADWSPDGARIAFSSNRNGQWDIYVMDVDGRNQRPLTRGPGWEMFPAWSPDGKQIAFFACDPEGRPKRQDIYVMNADGSNVRPLTDTPSVVDEDPAWSPDGKQIIFQSDRGGNFEIYVMNADGSEQRPLTAHRGGDFWPSWRPTSIQKTNPLQPTENLAPTPKAPAPAPTSAPLAATDAHGKTPISPDNAARVELVRTLDGHQDKVWNVAFSGDGAYMASSDQRGAIKVWDAALGQQAFAFSSQGASMNNLTFSPDSHLLASAQTIWDVKSRQVLHTLDGRNYYNAAFSPDGVWLAVSGQHSIKLWDVASGQAARTFKAQADTVSFSIAFSPDGAMLASGEHDGVIRLWNVASGQVARTFTHDARKDVHDVAFSPDGKLLASVSIDSTVRLWNVASGQIVHSMRHGDGLYGVAFSPDGRLVASAGCDRTVKLWGVVSGRLVHTLSHGDEVTSVAFSPDGASLASGAYDSQVYVWGISR